MPKVEAHFLETPFYACCRENFSCLGSFERETLKFVDFSVSSTFLFSATDFTVDQGIQCFPKPRVLIVT